MYDREVDVIDMKQTNGGLSENISERKCLVSRPNNLNS